MRRAVLLWNPAAGSAGVFRRELAAMMRVFAEHGISVEVRETTPEAGSARRLASEAVGGADLVVACGGDGTVHDVLQGVAHTGACLGVLPFGTANALARNLGLPMRPVEALRRLLRYAPRELPLSVARTERETRWFTVMAGAGPDGRLVHEMARAAKARAGRGAYYAEAARLFAMRRFPAFAVEYRLAGAVEWRRTEAVALMVSRVADLGGLFRGLTADSDLAHPHLVAKVLAAPAAMSLPAWFAGGQLGGRVRNPWLTTLLVEEIRCGSSGTGEEVYGQVDGEAVGMIPMSIRIEQSGLRLLMPTGAESRDG